MKSIRALVDHSLTWNQPKGLRQEYELRFGNDLVATLKFPKMLSTNAVAESGDGSWALERTGVFNTKITIRKIDSETPLASYTAKPFKAGGFIQLEGGMKFVVRIDGWHSTHELLTEDGESLFELKSRGFFKHFVDVKMNRRALPIEEFPSLLVFLFYVILLGRRDAAVHSAVH
jgi:hypothetical protein